MKKSVRLTAIFITLSIAFAMMPKQTFAQNGYVNFQVFYDGLSPYGQWVDYPDYGYVWIPDAGPDFVPYYSYGHWVFTNYGWTWVSDYDWGWAPFHYGRWNYDNYYGWFWVPDIDWAPAWVIWRHSRGYYGWAPMAPGISISIAYGRDYRMPYDRWVFVRERDFSRHDFHHYHVDRSNYVTIINNSTIINNTYIDNDRHSTYYSGPRREDVQWYSKHVVNVVNVRENDRPTQTLSHDQLNIYRPRIEHSEKDKKMAPQKVYTIKEVKPIANRRNVNSPSNNSNNRSNIQPKSNNTPSDMRNEQKNDHNIQNNSNRSNIDQQKNNPPIDKRNDMRNNNNIQNTNNRPNIQQQKNNQTIERGKEKRSENNFQNNNNQSNIQQKNNNKPSDMKKEPRNNNVPTNNSNDKSKEIRNNNADKNNNIQGNPQKNNTNQLKRNEPKKVDEKSNDKDLKRK
jgi:hypothetical protein